MQSARVNPGPDASGDMGIFPNEVDVTKPKLAFTGLKAFEEAPPEVKRLFTLEMGRLRDVKDVLREEMREQVAEHKYDFDSTCVYISNKTLEIRDMQKKFALLTKKGDRNGSGLHKLKRKVDGRRAALALLRLVNYFIFCDSVIIIWTF